MRKWFSVLLALILSLIPIVSFACQIPLERQGKRVYLHDQSQAELVSYNVFFRIRTGFSSVNTSMVIKNQNAEEPAAFIMGMPVQIDNISKIRDLSVVSEGQSLKVIQRSTLKDPPNEKETDVQSWFVWDFYLEPGQSKVVECSFSFDNKLELDGTEIVSYPLQLLENWSGTIKNLQIIVDLDFYGPYAFDPMPSLSPSQYDEGGRLTFKLKDVSSPPADFEISFKPMDLVMTRYIESKAESDNDIKAILEAYRLSSYDKTVSLIHDYLAQSNDTELMAELKYLEALSYQNLYDLDKALNIFNQLEPNPGFSESLSPIIRNKIIYDKTAILKTQADGDQKALDYLNSIKDSIGDDNIFAMWLDKEITLLAPPPPLVEDEPIEEDTNQENQEDASENETQVIEKISIGRYEFYIEELLVVAVVILVLIFIIASIIRKKRRRRRSSIFRY